MKRSLFFLVLFFSMLLNINGQWYQKQYHVNSIENLSPEELKLSLANAKETTWTGVGCAVVGGVAILYAKYGYKNGIPDDATFFEQIMGAQGMKVITGISGIALLGGGIITTIVGLDRTSKIKKVMNNFDIPYATITLNPVVLTNRINRDLYPGIGVVVRF
jgi:hypothetical protein